VEFIAEQGNDGRLRAVDVTGPDGANPQVCGLATSESCHQRLWRVACLAPPCRSVWRCLALPARSC